MLHSREGFFLKNDMHSTDKSLRKKERKSQKSIMSCSLRHRPRPGTMSRRSFVGLPRLYRAWRPRIQRMGDGSISSSPKSRPQVLLVLVSLLCLFTRSAAVNYHPRFSKLALAEHFFPTLSLSPPTDVTGRKDKEERKKKQKNSPEKIFFFSHIFHPSSQN